jgi:hypothetical protein
VIISVSPFLDKDFAAKTGIDHGIHTRVEPRFFESKIKMFLIEPFSVTIRRISRIFVPMSAVVRLGLLIPKRAADKKHF